MKKTIVMSVLGIAATMSCVNRAEAQGAVFFCNYNGGGASAPVSYANLVSSGVNAGKNVGSDFFADLLYSTDGGATYTDLNLGQTFAFNGTTGGSAATDGAGLFGTISSTVNLPPAGPVMLIVEAYNGVSYAAATFRGQSAPVSISNISTALPTGGLLSDNTFVTSPLTAFTVSAVPEPATLALAGLGGLASLIALRRKQA